MITNQNKQEIMSLAEVVKPDIDRMSSGFTLCTAGIYNGENRTDAIWVKDGLKSSFFFVSPCLRNARAETFIDCNAEYEFTFHCIERYGQRHNSNTIIDILNASNNRYAKIAENLASFYINEKIIGKVGCTRNRGAVLRTTNGVLLCSDKSIHEGITLANTWIAYDELDASQKKAVDMYDKGRYDLSKKMYSEYFLTHKDNRVKYNVLTKKGGVGTYRKRNKNKCKC